MAEYRTIALAQIIEPPAPVRATMDEEKLYELRDSIKRMGVLQPIIVVPVEHTPATSSASLADNDLPIYLKQDRRWEIVAGHRRFLAARLAALSEIPCVVYADGEIAKEAAMLHENIYREDLTAAEEGWMYCELAEKHQLTEDALCRMVRQEPAYIYARMDLVRKDAELAKLVAARKVNFSVAKVLLMCPDDAHRAYLSTLAADSGATARTARMWVDQWKSQQVVSATPPPMAATSDTGSQPVENTLKCHCCGGDKDPQNLRLIYVHWYELETWNKILTEAGMRPGPAPPAALSV